MKLALIRRQFSATGGAELYLQRLLAALGERGHELHLFTEAWTGPPAGVTVHPLGITASRAPWPATVLTVSSAWNGRGARTCTGPATAFTASGSNAADNTRPGGAGRGSGGGFFIEMSCAWRAGPVIRALP